MSDVTDAIDPVRVVHHGDPANPEPIRFATTREEHEAHVAAMRDSIRRDSLPRVVDPGAVVETVVTRRLVVVDSKNRERIIAAEDRDNMRLTVVSNDGEAELRIMVGNEAESGNPYVLIVASSEGGEVRIDVDPRGGTVEVEKMGVDEPRLDLKNTGVEVHHWHSRAIYPEPEGGAR